MPGRIWFDSAIDQGSEFQVTLPLEAQPLHDVQATTSEHPSKAPPVTAGG